MMRTRTIRHGCEAALFALGRCTIPFLPRRCITALARSLGAATCRLTPSLRKIAQANVDIVFGASLSPIQKQSLIREAFIHFARLALDLFWFSAFTERRLRRWVRFDSSFEHALQLRPAVLITLHLGNWEIFGQAVAERGYALHSVAAPLKNPLVNLQMIALRTRTGLKLIPPVGAVRALLQLLRRQERVALLIDQNTRLREGGIFVDFFGLPATFSKAPAALALRTQAPIVLCGCVPEADGGYRAYADAPMAPPAGPQAERALTRDLCRAMERWIERWPAYWLWMYKRWKYAPADADPAPYPFYVNRGGTNSVKQEAHP